MGECNTDQFIKEMKSKFNKNKVLGRNSKVTEVSFKNVPDVFVKENLARIKSESNKLGWDFDGAEKDNYSPEKVRVVFKNIS
jgi:hypothetical protein